MASPEQAASERSRTSLRKARRKANAKAREEARESVVGSGSSSCPKPLSPVKPPPPQVPARSRPADCMASPEKTASGTVMFVEPKPMQLEKTVPPVIWIHPDDYFDELTKFSQSDSKDSAEHAGTKFFDSEKDSKFLDEQGKKKALAKHTEKSEFTEYGYGRLKDNCCDLTEGRDSFEGYDRHVFLCYGRPETWPRDFNELDAKDDTLPARLFSAFNALKDEIRPKTILTVCGGCDESGIVDGDVLIFPDMVKYSLKSCDHDSVDSFVNEVLVNGEPSWSLGLGQEMEKGAYVFVCAHGNHDKKDGVCGGLVMEKMEELVCINDIKDIVFPIPCSDLGSAEYAANIIIYARNQLNEIDGHWYSYVCPSWISIILWFHIGLGEIYQPKWRGQMKEKYIKYFANHTWYIRGIDWSLKPKNPFPWNCLESGREMSTWGREVRTLQEKKRLRNRERKRLMRMKKSKEREACL